MQDYFLSFFLSFFFQAHKPLKSDFEKTWSSLGTTHFRAQTRLKASPTSLNIQTATVLNQISLTKQLVHSVLGTLYLTD